MFMVVKVHEIEYDPKNESLPISFDFDIEDSIVQDDQLLGNEVARLIRENTGSAIESCSVDVD
jgi:hypothetical protein